MITEDKVTEIFCVIDEFCKNFDAENGQKSFERVSLARWKMPQEPQRAVGCKWDYDYHHLLPFRLVRQFQALLPLLYTSASVRLFSWCSFIQPLRGTHASGVLPYKSLNYWFCSYIVPLIRYGKCYYIDIQDINFVYCNIFQISVEDNLAKRPN